MTETPCSTCQSFRGDVVGTCARGGPMPSEGCSDVNEKETCPEWRPESGWTPDDSEIGAAFNARLPF